MPEWSAEVSLSAEEARALVRAADPHAEVASLRPFAEGWDNVLFRTDDGWLYRIPRRAIAVPFVEVEAALLPRLAPRLPVAIPLPEALTSPSFPWPFLRYRMIPGTEAAQARLTASQRAALAAPLGRFLRALHAPDTASELGSMVQGDRFRRADMAYRVPKALESLRATAAAGLVDDRLLPRLEAMVRAAEGTPPVDRPVLVHGDFHMRHVLLHEDGTLAAVIDWGDVHRGDPGVDLQIGWSLLSPSAREDFLAAYGPVDARTRRVARVVAVFIACALLRSAADFGLPAVADEARLALANAVED